METDLTPFIPSSLAAPWRRCLVAYLLHLSSGSPHTVTGYGYILHRFLMLYPDPSCCTREDIESFLRMPLVRSPRAGSPPAPRTRNLHLHILKNFYEFAAEYQLISGPSPVSGLKRQKTRLTFRGMSYDELVRFLSVIPANTVKGLRDRAIFLTYFWTARRREEIARLRWGDLEYGTITDAEGRQYQGWLYHFVGKGRHGESDVAELPAPAKEAIDAYLLASGRLETIAPDDPLFIATRPPRGGGPPIDPKRSLPGQAIWRLLKDYCALAGLDSRRINVHSFRHTAAQLRHLHGESLRSLQRLLRHSSIATTNAYLETASSAADPGAHALMEDSKFLFGGDAGQ